MTNTCWIALLGAVSALSSSCGTPVTCGEGTELDTATNTCVPEDKGPDFNVIVDNFSIGDFEFSAVDVPEQLVAGTPDTRTLTIKNKGTKAREVVLLRYGVSPVQATIQELRDAIDDASEDEPLSVTYLGQVILDDLGVGETRQVSYTVTAPAGMASGMHGFFFAVDEVPLVRNEDGSYSVDIDSPTAVDHAGSPFPLGNAALVFAPATVIIGVPDAPNLRILSSSISNASFILDDTDKEADPQFVVTARLSSQGMDLTAAALAKAELKLPGHVVDVPGKDLGPEWFATNGGDFAAAPQDSTWKYDANRTFPLDFVTKTARAKGRAIRPTACKPAPTEADPEAQRCATIFNEEAYVDVYGLALEAEDAALLSATLDRRTQNPDIREITGTDGSKSYELNGQLTVMLTTEQAEYQNNVADNKTTLDVVFLIPEAGPAAQDTDSDNEGGEAQNSWGQMGPWGDKRFLDYSGGSTIGSTGAGARWGVDFEVDFDRLASLAPHAAYVKANGDVDIMFFGKTWQALRQRVSVNLGADKSVRDWVGLVKVTTFGVTKADIEYDYADFCTTSGSKLNCPWLFPDDEGELSEELPLVTYGRSLEIEKELELCCGVAITARAEISAEVGVKMRGAFYTETATPANRNGVQIAIGPYLRADAEAEASLEAGFGRASVTGSSRIFLIEAMPTVYADLAAKADAGATCLKYSQSRISYELPITLFLPNGTIDWAVELGWCPVCDEIGGNIYKFDLGQKTWVPYSAIYKWAGKAGATGMCADAVTPAKETWRSPTSCDGYYCKESSMNWLYAALDAPLSPDATMLAYKDVFTAGAAPKDCLQVDVTGTTEAGKDFVRIYRQTGPTAWALVTSYSGSSLDTSRRVCPPADYPRVYVTLETNKSSQRRGVSVEVTKVE